MPGSLSNEDEGQDDMDFEDDMPDDDDEGERNTVPLTPLDSFFSDSDSLKQQKKQKPKKMKEGKMPKVKKRKKEEFPVFPEHFPRVLTMAVTVSVTQPGCSPLLAGGAGSAARSLAGQPATRPPGCLW
ncbi:Polyribonucleotide nucleotidyltransferase [Dissostichus eleginoides]|uniref:Polyribonucleotide nucleotidyltransferase n=1 Tax=Dissostichus eleginoides TaxID=100907 RepID=A0AAD9CHK6_DISEL|nr:Polyribonucleotide nucleotidyltransferase [Dissostichus eleginoides]